MGTIETIHLAFLSSFTS